MRFDSDDIIGLFLFWLGENDEMHSFVVIHLVFKDESGLVKGD